MSLQVPPKADILCEIKVIKVENVGEESAVQYLLNKPDEVSDISALLQSVKETRERANNLFSKGKYDQAIKHYQKIIQSVQFARTHSDKEADYRIEILMKIHTNLVICHNKREEWHKALAHISLIEEIGSIDNNPKVLHAKGRALMKTGDNEAAGKALVKAQRLLPTNPEINASIAELVQRKTSYDQFINNFAEKLKFK